MTTESQQRLPLWLAGTTVPLCQHTRAGRRAETAPTTPCQCGWPSPPSPGMASPHSSSFKTNKEGKGERREGMRRSPEPCQNQNPAPHGAHPLMHPPRPQDPSPRSSAVQWGSCGQRNLPPPRQQHITSILVTFPFFFPPYFCPIQLTCWHTPEFTPQSFLRALVFFKADPFLASRELVKEGLTGQRGKSRAGPCWITVP